jgi:hypothetical protein
VRPGYWIIVLGVFASACTFNLRRADAVASPPAEAEEASATISVATTRRRNDNAPAPKSALASDSWLRFRGETRCSGISEVVSFAFSTRRHEVRDFMVEETCQHPPTGINGKVRWKFANRFSPDSKGLFAVSAADSTVSAQTAITIRGKFRASGRISQSSASGTLSDYVAIECSRGQTQKNCRTWNARALTEGDSIVGAPPRP